MGVDSINYKLSVYSDLKRRGIISAAMLLQLLEGIERSSGETFNQIANRFNELEARPPTQYMTPQDFEKLRKKAGMLNTYINRHPSRAVKIEDALGVTGSRLLNDLLKAVF